MANREPLVLSGGLMEQVQVADTLATPGAATFGTSLTSIMNMLQVGSGAATNAGLILGTQGSGTAAIWPTSVTPSGTNYILAASSVNTWLQAPTQINLQIGGNTVVQTTGTGVSVAGALSSTGVGTSPSEVATGIANAAAPTGTPSATGGTVAAATYYAKIVIIDGNGNVTAGGTESLGVTTTGATSSIAWTWPAVSGAASYQIWVGVAAGAETSYFTSATNSYTQTTSAGTAGTIPTVNMTPIVKVGTGATGLVIQPYVSGGSVALYSTSVTPSTTNYSFDTSATSTYVNASTQTLLAVGGTPIVTTTSTGVAVTGNLSSTGTTFTAGSITAGTVAKINGLSTVNNAPVVSLFRSGLREGIIAIAGDGSMIISNTGGLANYLDATLGANLQLQLPSTGGLNVTGNIYSTAGISAATAYTNTFTDGIVLDYTTGNGRISVGAADSITFYTGGVATTALAALTTTGTTFYNPISIGAAFNTNIGVDVAAITGTAASTYGFRAQHTLPNTSITVGAGFSSAMSTPVAAIAYANVQHFRADTTTIGAGSSIANQYGFYSADMLAATNNYGYYSGVTGGANKWGFMGGGNADNNLGNGVTTHGSIVVTTPYAPSSFTYTDGLIVDYITGTARLSSGPSDNITFYTGGIANTQMAQMTPTGTSVVGTLTSTGVAQSSANMAVGLAAPLAPTGAGSASGGTVAAGTYYAKIAAVDANGNTTAVGPESVGVTVSGATSSITWTWAAVAGAVSYQIWVGISPGGESSYFTSSTLSYLQTVSAGTAGTPPTLNATPIVKVGSGVTGLIIQPFTGGGGSALYSAGATPSTTNYALYTNSSGTALNGTTTATINVNGVAQLSALTNGSNSLNGINHQGIFGAAYTDGLVTDYTTGNGRISVGAADTISFYNGGIANTLLAQLGTTGLAMSVPFEFQSGTISAAGTNQGTATAVTADNTYVTAGTGGVILPTAVVGREISVSNNTAASIVVYPAVGASIENAAANAGVTLPAYATLTLSAKTTTNWWAIQPVYNPGTNIAITQSANGTVTWNVTPSITLTGSATVGTQTSTGAFATTGKAVVNNNASATYTFGANQGYVAFTGTNVATLTINYPAAAAGIDGLEVEVYTQAAVGTAVTFASTGATFVGAPATLAAGSMTKFIYHHATLQWLPRG